MEEKNNKKNSVSISRSNMKMGVIPSISFPPILSCPNCTECKHACYALKMCRRRKTTLQAWQNNFAIWKSNPEAVKIAIMNASITSCYFRYFVGGDIPDPSFFKMMVEVAKKIKTCQFLAFTKNFNVVNDYLNQGHRIPRNLHVIFSEWMKPIDNPHDLPTSKVIFKGQEAPHGALVCGGNCCKCIAMGVGCWQLKKGQKIYFYEH